MSFLHAKSQMSQKTDANATCVSSKIMRVHVACEWCVTRHCGGEGRGIVIAYFSKVELSLSLKLVQRWVECMSIQI